MINYNLLKGKIYSKGFDLTTFHSVIGVSRSTFYKKMQGTIDFKVSEVEKICKALGIAPKEACTIFFA